MLDHVVHAEVRQVKRVARGVAVEQLRGLAREQDRERVRHVVRLADRRGEVRELDVLPVAREYSCVPRFTKNAST